jgi:hypothetical protein
MHNVLQSAVVCRHKIVEGEAIPPLIHTGWWANK